MEIKKNLLPIIAVLAICAVALAAILLPDGKQAEGEYSIPVAEGKLSWGMSADEVTAVLGDPTQTEVNESGTTLTYEKTMSGELGDYSKVVLYIGENDLTNRDETVVSSGLCSMTLYVDQTTKEAVLDAATAFYGALEGGSTQMELDLKKTNENYFNEWYVHADWKVSNLSEEEYERLEAFYAKNRVGSVLTKEDTLLGINVSGVAEGKSYPCVVELHATEYVMYQVMK